MLLFAVGRVFSWGKSSRGRLGREVTCPDDECPSLVKVAAAGCSDQDEDRSHQLRVTSLCSSHSLSLVCFTQRKTSSLSYLLCCCKYIRSWYHVPSSTVNAQFMSLKSADGYAIKPLELTPQSLDLF